jgi:hypothetical protein
MNILTEKLPASVVVKGRKYKINADFKTALKIINYSEKEQGVKLMIYALKTFYDEVPEDIEGAILAMRKFYNSSGEESKNTGRKEPLFSFVKDADLIFSSFYSQYGINLTQDNLHWYVFLALLRGICGDNVFSRVLEIRSLDLSEVKDEAQKKKLAVLKQKYSLEGQITLEEGFLRGVF